MSSTGFLGSFLNRHRSSPASKSSPSLPRIIDPPPSREARRDKERRWFESIRGGSGGGSKSSPPSPHAPDRSVFASVGSDPLPITASTAPSIRSTSKGLFKTKSRDSTMRSRQASAQSHTSTGSRTLEPPLPTRASLYPPAPPRSLSHRSSTTEDGFTLVRLPDDGTRRVSPSSSYAAPVIAFEASIHGEAASTKTLAVQLQELSVAHEDALISDDEYRVLREALFTRTAAVDAARPSQAHNALMPIRSAPQASDAASLMAAASVRKAPSVRSSRSAVTSIFRKATNPRASAVVEDWHDLHLAHLSASQSQNGQEGLMITSPTLSSNGDSASVFSGRTVFSNATSTASGANRFSRVFGMAGSPSLAEVEVLPLPPRSRASIRRLQSSSSSMRSGKSGSGTMPRRPGSSSSSAQTSPSTTRRRLANASTESEPPIPLLEDDPDASPEELRIEIAQLEAEAGRVAHEFRQLEMRLTTRMTDEGVAVEGELKQAKARRRKVSARYEARLEWLRARLRSSELRDRLRH